LVAVSAESSLVGKTSLTADEDRWRDCDLDASATPASVVVPQGLSQVALHGA
jgi:hypothetical protein